ncbi:hypothetical protein [Cupriavidus sp. TMH.W2]|uniref:hypothetical protein n=1 Tax=Cupriavidus sp. TMH.W2 TaxID=3434465 RepID=UPI003D7743FB
MTASLAPVMPTDPATPARASGSREDFLVLLRVPNNRPDKVDRILQARLIGLGLGRVCERCGGSGHYSFNAIDGTTCFGCRGSGHVAQKLTADLYARAAAEVAAGRLDTYLAEVRARAEAKQAADMASQRVMKAWQAVDARFPYKWQLAVDRLQPHYDLSQEVNKPMSEAYQKVAALSSELNALPHARRHCKTVEDSKRLDAKIEATRQQLIAATDKAMQVIELAAQCGVAVMARYHTATPTAAEPARARRDDSPSP